MPFHEKRHFSFQQKSLSFSAFRKNYSQFKAKFLTLQKFLFSFQNNDFDMRLPHRKNDYESAMFHFQQLLKNKPDYWVALARLVEVMRRTGTVLYLIICTGLYAYTEQEYYNMHRITHTKNRN
jgi:hypothetical protein